MCYIGLRLSSSLKTFTYTVHARMEVSKYENKGKITMKAIVFLYFMFFQSLHIQKLSHVYEKCHGIEVDGARDFLMIVSYFI